MPRNRTFGRLRPKQKKLWPKMLKCEEKEDEMPALDSLTPTPALVRSNASPLGLGVSFPDDQLMTGMDGSIELRAEGPGITVRAVSPEDFAAIPFRDLTPLDEGKLHQEAVSIVSDLTTLMPEPMDVDTQGAQVATASQLYNDLTALDSPSPSERSIEFEALTTFHPFSNLPKTIRAKIWKLNLPGPRLVEIIVCGNPYEEFVPSAQRVTNLYVCQESRALALLSHPLSFEVDYNTPLVPFNFETDTLLLGQALSWKGFRLFRKLCNPEDLAKVKRLMIDAALERCERKHRDHPFRDRGGGLAGLSRPLFTNVVEFTVAFTGDTDPVNWWANKSWFPTLPYHYHARTSGISHYHAYRDLKRSWESYFNIPTNRCRISPQRCAKFRYGSMIEAEGWDPVIKRWAIPAISTVGLNPQVLDYFRHGNDGHCWAELVMDRVIDGVFA